MIEDAPLTDNVTRISVQSSHEDLIDNIRDCEFSHDQTYGFDIDTEDSNSLSATLTSASPTRIQTFDEGQEQIVTEDVIRTEITRFRLDFEREFLEVFAGKEQNGEVLNRLGQITTGLVTHDQTFDLAKLYDLLHQSQLATSVNALRINNFSLRENTNGSCYLNIYDNQTTKSIIREYKSDITHLNTIFTIESEEITVGLYRSGSIRIHNKTNKHAEILKTIKDMMSELEVDS